MSTPASPPPILDEVAPGQPGWDAARTAFNLTVDQRPATIVRVRRDRDVIAAVRLAQERGLRVAVQGTTHGAATLPPLDGVLLLRTDAMRAVTVDPAARLVTFEAGARAQDVVGAAAAHGLAAPAGFASTVGMTGYVLGGGLGWLARRGGFAAHAVEAVELVSADGRLRRVDAEHDPELSWALRGGGGGFGVVCRTTMRLEAISAVHGGALYWPVAEAPAVLGAWRRWTEELPDDVTSVGRILALPPLDAIPEPLRGRAWCVVESVHATSGAEHDRLLAPLRSLAPAIDTMAALPVTALADLHGDPREPVPVVSDHVLLGPLDDRAIAALTATVGAGSGSPLVSVELRHLGGALARGTDADGPLGALHARYALYALGMAPGPGAEAASADRLAALRAALAPWTDDRRLANFVDRPVAPERVYAPGALARLRAVARRVDPGRRFVSQLAALALLAVVVLLGATGSDAQAKPGFEYRTYRAEVTGLQTMDWRYRSAVPLQDETGWTRGDGSQTLGWSTRRAATLGAQRNLIRRIGPLRLPAYELTGTTGAFGMKGTVTRSSAIVHKDAPPVCEGSDLDAACLFVPLDITLAQACGRRALPVETFLSVTGEHRESLRVTVRADAQAAYRTCGPDTGTQSRLTSGANLPMDVDLRNVAGRVGALRKGRTLTLHAEARSPGCPLPTARAGFTSCGTTAVTVELTRRS